MDPTALQSLLEGFRAGDVTLEQAVAKLARLPFTDIGLATVDHHRSLRQGAPEIIFGEGKTPEEIVAIARTMSEAGENVLVTRLKPEGRAALAAAFPSARFNDRARTARMESKPRAVREGEPVAIVTAGTSDLAVAEECAETLDALGVPVTRVNDVGVAGIHRLLHRVDALRAAACVVAIAGMEGALPSVIGGLVAVPVIAVPTSVGYGTAFGGVTALFAMLTSCASGLVVVNIDNGFGAAMAAHRVLAGAKR